MIENKSPDPIFVEDLRTQLNIKKSRRLDAVLKPLVNLQVLREEERSGTRWYEFKHDYVAAELSQWIQDRKEKTRRRQLKRLWFAVFPGLFLLLALFTYFFIRYNTFYAGFSIPSYPSQQEEIIISRGFSISGQTISTGLFLSDVKGHEEKNKLRKKFKISFWDRDNWLALADILDIAERGKFFYLFGQRKIGLQKLEEAFKKGNFQVRVKAAAALGRMGKTESKAIDALLQALEDENADVRHQAAAVLGHIGKAEPKVIAALLWALKDKESMVRFKTAAALVSLGKANQRVVAVFLQVLNYKNFYFLWPQAVEALYCLGKADPNVIDALLQNLKDNDYQIKEQAAAALDRLGKADKNFIDALFQALNDRFPAVRQKAAEALGHLGKAYPNVIDFLLQAIKDKNSAVRQKVTEALGLLGKTDQKVIAALLQAMKDNNKYVQLQSADSLVNLGIADRNIIDVMLKLLQKKIPVQFKTSAIQGRLGKAERKVINVLFKLLKDNESDVRLQAADTLVKLGKVDQDVIAALLKAMKDEEPDIRQKAGASLGRLWQNKSEAELLKMLEDTRSEYRTAAAYALASKKSLSPGTLIEINRLKDFSPHPWVRLGAWKAFELLQEKQDKKEKE